MCSPATEAGRGGRSSGGPGGACSSQRVLVPAGSRGEPGSAPLSGPQVSLLLSQPLGGAQVPARTGLSLRAAGDRTKLAWKLSQVRGSRCSGGRGRLTPRPLRGGKVGAASAAGVVAVPALRGWDTSANGVEELASRLHRASPWTGVRGQRRPPLQTQGWGWGGRDTGRAQATRSTLHTVLSWVRGRLPDTGRPEPLPAYPSRREVSCRLPWGAAPTHGCPGRAPGVTRQHKARPRDRPHHCGRGRGCRSSGPDAGMETKCAFLVTGRWPRGRAQTPAGAALWDGWLQTNTGAACDGRALPHPRRPPRVSTDSCTHLSSPVARWLCSRPVLP